MKIRGFTLIEVMIVMALMLALLSFSMPALTTSQRHAEVNDLLTLLISDIRNQQFKAMLGDTEGTGIATSSGVYFETNRYTLFRGKTYSSVDSRNYVINLSPKIQFTSTNFPNLQLVFAPVSGEVSNFSNDSYSISLIDTQENSTKVININKYGNIESIN